MKASTYKHSLRRTKQRGFTLVEILIVLALIGIVAGLAMSNYKVLVWIHLCLVMLLRFRMTSTP